MAFLMVGDFHVNVVDVIKSSADEFRHVQCGAAKHKICADHSTDAVRIADTRVVGISLEQSQARQPVHFNPALIAVLLWHAEAPKSVC
jgi:hypothetical protein